jgi:hypothetical protein
MPDQSKMWCDTTNPQIKTATASLSFSDKESPFLCNAGIVLTRLPTGGCVVKGGNSDGDVSNFLRDGTHVDPFTIILKRVH